MTLRAEVEAEIARLRVQLAHAICQRCKRSLNPYCDSPFHKTEEKT